MKTKYRAWIEEYKELCRVLSIDLVNDSFCVLPTAELEGGGQVEIKGLDKLEEYININDDNGTEVYLHDIINVIEKTIEADKVITGIIIYDEGFGAYMVDFPYWGESRTLSDFIDSGLLVVGNEHQNINLLGI